MKTKIIFLSALTLLFSTGIAFCAEPQKTETRSAIGIKVDSSPLPELLVKHLGLKQGQGRRIANILKNSAADEAGLERDDIITGYQGEDVYDGDVLTNAVHRAGIGTEVSLDIIHLGQRKTLKLKLKALTTGQPDWKYRDEPQVEQMFQPGRIFRFGPDDQDWTQIFDNQMPGNFRNNINSFFNELYSSYYNVNGKQYSVTIEGSPEDNDSKITVKIDNDEYKTKIGELDKLPEEYREAAKNAIENAKQKQSNRTFRSPNIPDDFGSNFLPRLRSDSPLLNVPDAFDGSIFQRMEEQMKQMQERMKELEKNQNSFFERWNEKEKQQ